MSEAANPTQDEKTKELLELKRVVHSLATVPREIAFMVTPQRSRRLCWPVSEDKIKDYIETERFIDDEFEPVSASILRSAIQHEQEAMDAADKEMSLSNDENNDSNDDDQLRKCDTPVVSLMPEYHKEKKLRKRKREEEQEDNIIEHVELTVTYNDQVGYKQEPKIDPYLYGSRECDLELRLLVQQLWHRLFENRPDVDQSNVPTLDNTTTSFLILEAKNMLNELMTTVLHLRSYGGTKPAQGLSGDWQSTDDKRKRYAAASAGSWETVLSALSVMQMPTEFVASVTSQLQSIYHDKQALDSVKKPLVAKSNSRKKSQIDDDNGSEAKEVVKEKERKKEKRKKSKKKRSSRANNNNQSDNSEIDDG